MDVKEIRLAKLRGIIQERFGGKAGQCADFLGIKRPQMSRWVTHNDGARQGIHEDSAREIEEKLGLAPGWLDQDDDITLLPSEYSVLPSADSTKALQGVESFPNSRFVPLGKRPIPVIDYIQAGKMTEIADPYAPGDGFAVEYCDDDLGAHAFALEIEGESMMPEFRPGDRVVIDPDITPNPGDYVAAKNGRQEATFKKYRPRGIDSTGTMVFELIPLNPDYPTMRSDLEPLQIIGTMVEHRKKFRRKK